MKIEEGKIVQQNSTDKEIFKPTTNMEKWLDTAIQLSDLSPTKVSEVSGIDRTSWYHWIKDEQFIAWFRGEWDKRIRSYGPVLDMIGLKKASSDYKFWEAMQKRVGNLQESSSIQINNFVPILGGKSINAVPRDNSNKEDSPTE